ncbi:molecular chaperone [Vibrio splendidus]
MMLKQNAQTLFGLSLVCRFLYSALHQAPNAEMLSAIYDDQLVNDWPIEMTHPLLTGGISLLQNKPVLNDLNIDFAELFIGPNQLKAAPWASVYLNEEQTTFGEQTLAIRSFYSQFGIEIDTGEREPDDHIGLIFSFLAHLCSLTADAMEQDDKSTVCPITRFLEEHVLTWAPRMLQLMKANASSDFYRGIAMIAEGTLHQLALLVNAKFLIVPLHR